ncbi:MAG: hypothetical protein ACYC6N_11920 [Pirellulaceae bacterium]
MANEGHRHVQEPTANAAQTSNEVRSPAKEDVKAESARQEADRQEEMMPHPGWLLIIIGLLIAGIGLIWLIAPPIPWFRKLPGDVT